MTMINDLCILWWHNRWCELLTIIACGSHFSIITVCIFYIYCLGMLVEKTILFVRVVLCFS